MTDFNGPVRERQIEYAEVFQVGGREAFPVAFCKPAGQLLDQTFAVGSLDFALLLLLNDLPAGQPHANIQCGGCVCVWGFGGQGAIICEMKTGGLLKIKCYYIPQSSYQIT